MPFGYKVPTFNCWFRYFYWQANGTGVFPYGAYIAEPFYFRGQLRGGDRAANGFAFQIAMAKGLAVRDRQSVKDGFDIVQAAGWGEQYAIVDQLEDVGAGFFNEHRVLVCSFIWVQQWVNTINDIATPRIDTNLEPPEGAFMMPSIDPISEWIVPAGAPFIVP